MNGMDANAKKRFEIECLVKYPATGPACARDYKRTCPKDWFENTANECIAPVDYHRGTTQKTTCNTVQYLNDLSPEEKKTFEFLCDVKWPCLQDSNCKRSYNSPCPSAYYSYSGTSCVATASYTGKCSRILHNLIALSQAQKEELEQKCEFRWPCDEEVELEEPDLNIKLGEWRNELNNVEFMALDGPIV
jgi:CPW-WPC domain-containing protein